MANLITCFNRKLRLWSHTYCNFLASKTVVVYKIVHPQLYSDTSNTVSVLCVDKGCFRVTLSEDFNETILDDRYKYVRLERSLNTLTGRERERKVSVCVCVRERESS